jgi:hypothetical protein
VNCGRSSDEEEVEMISKVYYRSSVPQFCQVQEDRKIIDRFVDGKTLYGPWANMHPETHEVYGVGLGTGRGQMYQKQPDGRWLKIKG